MPLSVTDATNALKTTLLNILRLIAHGKFAGTRLTSREVLINPNAVEDYVTSGAPMFASPPFDSSNGARWFDYGHLVGISSSIVGKLQKEFAAPDVLDALTNAVKPLARAAAGDLKALPGSDGLDPTSPGYTAKMQARRQFCDRISIERPNVASATIDDLALVSEFAARPFDNTFNPKPINARHGEIVAAMTFLDALLELVNVAGNTRELIDADTTKRLGVSITKSNAVLDTSPETLFAGSPLTALYYTRDRFKLLTANACEIALAAPVAVFTRVVEVPSLRDPFVKVQLTVTTKAFANACGVTLASVVEKYL